MTIPHRAPARTPLLALGAALVLAAAPAAAQQQQGGQGQQRGQTQQQQGQQEQQAQRQQAQQRRQGGRVPSEYQRVLGRVVGIRPIEVRGVSTPNYIAGVVTPQGQPVYVDLGQTAPRFDIARGDVIRARGRPVRAGNKVVLLADVVRVGGRTYEVDRPAFRRPDR